MTGSDSRLTEGVKVEDRCAECARPAGQAGPHIGPPGRKATFASQRPRFWRLRWWFARTFKTRDYRYVENDRHLPDDFNIEAVARRIIHEHRDTLRRLAEDD